MNDPAAALALCRFGQDAAASLLWGASAFLWLCVPPGLSAAVALRLRVWALAAAGVALVATLAKLPAEVASVGEGWGDALDPAAVGAVLGDTGAGRAWAVQAGAALLLAAAFGLPVRARLAATAIASGLMIAALCLTGHAAAPEGWRGALSRANDVVHVLSGGVWFGALAPVLVILGHEGGGARRGEGALALRGFSRVGHAAVALVLLSGAASSALVLGRWPLDLRRPYEALLDAKIAAVLAMTGLALLNRYVLVPHLARQPGAGEGLRLGTLAEVPLGLAAIALVAVFGLLDPG